MSAPHPILVGYDGSPGAKRALIWAGREAAHSGRELQVLAAESSGLLARHRDELHEAMRMILDAAVVRLHKVHPQLPVQTMTAEGSPADALLEHAPDTDLLVVGRRGHGAVADALLGSVSLRVTAHAPCPVVVVPPAAPMPRTGGVVVGVADTTDAPALDFAAGHASQTGADVTAVHAWTLPVSGFAPELALPLLADAREMIAAHDEVLERLVRTARPRFPDTLIEPRTIEGSTGQVLAAEAADAALLVIGAHRKQGAFPLRIAPTAHYVLHHARCPVAVVPEAAKERGGAAF